MNPQETQQKILQVIESLKENNHTGVNDGQIAKQLKLDPQEIQGHLSLMEKAGYITVTKLLGGNGCVIYLTPEGKTHLHNLDPGPQLAQTIDSAALRAQLQRLDDVELETLVLDHFPTVMDKFSRGLRHDEKLNLLLDYIRRRPEEASRLVTLLSPSAAKTAHPQPSPASSLPSSNSPSDVQTGTFIGRDQIVVISGYTGADLERVLERLQETLGSGRSRLCTDSTQQRLTVRDAGGHPQIVLSADAAEQLTTTASRQGSERAYLTALLVNPRYGRWATQFVPLAATMPVSECPPGWSELSPEFTLLEVSGEGAGRKVRRIRLEDITQAVRDHPTLVLLGEPGSGKTTTLYRLALDIAGERLRTGEGRLPLYLSLADYRGYASPYAFVEQGFKQRLPGVDLGELLRQGQLFLCCDALNEMPFSNDRDYRERVAAWRRFVQEWPGNQLLFTCRSRDYGEPLGFQQVEIERLDPGRIEEFLEKYLPPDLAADAWQRLQGTPLFELMGNPYYLSMLACIVQQRGTWPANRAALFRSFVRTLLERERRRDHPDWVEEEAMCDALAILAEQMQPLGEGTRLPKGELLSRLPDEVTLPGDGRKVATPPERVLRLGLAATLLDVERIPDHEEQVRFYHHQLQEYFAARALLRDFKGGEALDDRWRQPSLKREMPDPGPLGDNEPLPPPPTTGWEEPTVLAAGLAPDPAGFVGTVRRANPVLAARCLAEIGMDGLAEVVAAVQAELLQMMGEAQVHRRARIAAGEALGQIGDPRFRELRVGGTRLLLPPLVAISAGSFRMGSSAWEVWQLQRRGFPAKNERPRHPVDLASFMIGQFPVTNAEYACFVADGGYHEEGYWPTAAARAWLRGEEMEGGPAQRLLDTWSALKKDPGLLEQARRAGWSARDLKTWKQLIGMEEGAVRKLFAAKYEKRSREQPAFWGDARYNVPLQPVVGVTWHEALAYCTWLTEKLRGVDCTLSLRRAGRAEEIEAPAGSLVVRLPSEAEWERAAKGPRGARYPWGNRWDPDRANTWEGHVLHPTPVGCYPGGATGEGLYEGSGNVWEWTRSLYYPYPYDPDDGREELEEAGDRVLRGGSWANDRRNARCAFRNRDLPALFNVIYGFRVGVVSLGNPDF